jgi:transposase-like protein
MAQHFLLSRSAKTLTLASVFRMSDAEAVATFRKLRWPATDGAPVCSHCGGLDAYDCRRPNGSPRFRCRACRKDFSITSGTLFGSHKLPLRGYLAAIAIFCNEVKGKSMLALSRDLGTSYKAAFVLAHKLREAMAEELKGRKIGGEGKVAEVDGGYFGGYSKPANYKENRRDRRLLRNQTGKRKVVVRERDGNSVPAVFRTESQALSFVRSRIAKGTIVNADEASAWDGLHDRFEVRRVKPRGSLQPRRRVHQHGRGILQPHAPGRGRAPSPHRRRLPAALRARGFMARRQPPHAERGSGASAGSPRHEARQVRRLHRILAAAYR